MSDESKNPTPADSKATEPEPDLMQSFQKTVALLVPFSIVLSVIGFAATFMLITRQTTLVSFEANPVEYIVYGVSVILVSMVKNFATIVVFLVVLLFVMIGGIFQNYRMQQSRKPVTFHRILDLSWMIIQSLMSAFILVLLAFGFSDALNPSSLSGVVSSTSPRKSVIALIFKENIDPQVWHLRTEDNNPRRTKPLSLIFEYSDSVLVKDLETGAIVKVQKDVLAGIADDSSFDPSKLPTIVPTP